MWPFRRKRGRELFRTYELAVIDALREAMVAGVEPRRRKVRRYEPDGELVGEYATVREALAEIGDA
jgi:hypothetical protein